MNDKILIEKSYVECSKYRTRVMKACGTEVKTPTKLAHESNIRTNHISKTLKELKLKGFMECINEDAKKGRLYRLTDKGLAIYKVLE